MYQNSYQKLLKRSRKLYLIAIGLLFILILITVGKQHYIDVMNNPIKLSDIQLDIPLGMTDYKTHINYDKASLGSKLLVNFTSGTLKTLIHLAQVLSFILVLFIGFKIVRMKKQQGNIDNKLSVNLIVISFLSLFNFAILPTFFSDVIENENSPKSEITEYVDIFRIIGYYTNKNKSKEDINYLSNQLYALIAPEYITPNDIGRPIEKLPNRIGYLFEQAMKQDGVKWEFDADDSVIIANKAIKYEKEYRDIAEYNAVIFWKLQWVVMTILGVMAAISTKMILVRLRLRKKIEILRKRK